MTPAAFVRANTCLAVLPYVPEVRLYLAEEVFGLWERTQQELDCEMPVPFWAFAWVGGQALARHVLDHPGLVAGRNVVDLAAGSGLVAIAAAKAGAATVTASEIDCFATAAIAANASANGVTVAATVGDVLDRDSACADIVLAGDVCYEQPTADRMLGFLERAWAGGTDVLVADPGRGHLPHPRFEALATYEVPAMRALEATEVKQTTVWQPT